MPREKPAFRDVLEDVLERFDGRRMLSLKDVRAYTGFANNRAIKRRYPFVDGYISAVVFARCLAGGDSDG